MGSGAEVSSLLGRMRGGDREAVGEFIDRYGGKIRRRVRGQLGVSMRRLFDSQEILSTVARRLDSLVTAGDVRAREEDQLWALVFQIARFSIVDKARVMERLATVEAEDRDFAVEVATELEGAAEGEESDRRVERMFLSLPDPVDRQILEMWLRDVPQVAIGRALGMPAGTVRRRWRGIKDRLAPRMSGGGGRW